MKAFAFAQSLLAAGASAALTRSRGMHEGGRQRLASGSLRSLTTPPDQLVHDVVEDLQDFLTNLQGDQADDDKLAKEWMCLCKNDTNMQQEIDDSNALIATYTSTIEEKTALSNTLTAELATLFGKIGAKDTEITQLEEREEEASGDAENKINDLNSNIEALANAIDALSAHNQDALLQAPQALRQVASIIQHRLREHPSELALSPEQEEMVSLLSHGQVPNTYWNDYQNQSGTVFGILRQLHEGFESDLSEATAQNETRVAGYNKLHSALSKQKADMETEHSEKTSLKGTTDADKETAGAHRTAAEGNRDATQLALEEMTAACKDNNDTYSVRKKTRGEEIAAITKAISILDSDPAYTAFKHADVAFLQERARSVSKGGRGRLLNGRVHAFPEVKDAIQKLIRDLEEEGETEKAQEEKCRTEVATRRETNQSTQEEIDALEEQISSTREGLTKQPAGASTAVKTANEDLVQMQQDFKKESELRAEQSRTLLAQIAHSQKAQRTLNKAIEALRSFYNGARESTEGGITYDEAIGFETYQNQEETQVIDLLQKILDHAKTLEDEATTAERNAQNAYATLTSTEGAEITSVANRKKLFEQIIVDTELDLASKNAELALATTRKQAETQALEKVEESCAFLIENFNKRQESRESEIDGLEQVIVILEGSAH